jgi:hypothetical protein
VLLSVFAVCAFADTKPRMSEREVVAIAMRAIAAKFPSSVGKRYAYAAYYKSESTDIWVVDVPHLDAYPGCCPGEPNAWVRDRDGKVLKVFLVR